MIRLILTAQMLEGLERQLEEVGRPPCDWCTHRQICPAWAGEAEQVAG